MRDNMAYYYVTVISLHYGFNIQHPVPHSLTFIKNAQLLYLMEKYAV